jgi:hypothetical protein
MKKLSLTEIEAKTAREQDTNLFKEDLALIIDEDLKTYLPALNKGLRGTQNLVLHLKGLIADLALNLHWLFDENTGNVTVKGLNGFNCAFALQDIGLIARRWGKEPKLSPKYNSIKTNPENDTRHLKFGLWFEAIKDGLVKVEDNKVLKLAGFEGETRVFSEFNKCFKAPNTPGFKPYTFQLFENETEAFIQFYNQITKKYLKPINAARSLIISQSIEKSQWRSGRKAAK